MKFLVSFQNFSGRGVIVALSRCGAVTRLPNGLVVPTESVQWFHENHVRVSSRDLVWSKCAIKRYETCPLNRAGFGIALASLVIVVWWRAGWRERFEPGRDRTLQSSSLITCLSTPVVGYLVGAVETRVGAEERGCPSVRAKCWLRPKSESVRTRRPRRGGIENSENDINDALE